MFIEFLTQNKFYDRYIDLFASRLTVENMEAEDSNIDIGDERRAIEFYNSKHAITELISSKPDELNATVLFDLEDNLTEDLYFFQRGYRKTQVIVKKAKTIVPPAGFEVPTKMMYLIYSYNKSELPVYEKEARFHIDLVRTQPFEDCNKRCAKILTAYNLLKQNKAPIIVKASEADEYFDYIDYYDVDGMTKFLEKKSKEELNVMIGLYKRIVGNDIIAPEKNEGNVSLVDFIENENRISMNATLQDVQSAKKLSLKKVDNK